MNSSIRVQTIIFTVGFAVASLLLQCGAAEFKIQYSPKEVAALEKFRPLVDSVLYKDSMKTDAFLIRWIRDANFNLNAANQKLRKSVAWKKENKIEELDVKDLNSTHAIILAGFDRTGSPLYMVNFGGWNIRRVAISAKRGAFLKHLHAVFELGLKHTDELREQGQNVTQWILVAATAGLNLREHLCVSCLSLYTDFVHDYEERYPGTVKHIVIVNAPRIFERIQGIVKQLMSPATRDGFRVFGHNKAETQKWFLSICSPEQLLIQFGGTRDRF